MTDLITTNSIVTPQLVLEMTLGGKAKGTVDAYKSDYADFAFFANNQQKCESLPMLAKLIALNNGQANAVAASYRNDLLARKFKPATINRHLSALSSYVSEARRFGLIEWELDVRHVRHKQYRDVAGPGHQNYLKMLAMLNERKDKKGTRDHAILRIMYDAGLRRNEVLTLDLEHVDTEREWGESKGGLNILRKRNTERTWVGLGAPTMKAVKAWIDLRGTEDGPLFTRLDFEAKYQLLRMNEKSYFNIVKKIGRDVGMQKPTSPHRLRHGGATRAAKQTNGNAVAVAAFLGHSNLQTASIYIDAQRGLQGSVAEMVASDE